MKWYIIFPIIAISIVYHHLEVCQVYPKGHEGQFQWYSSLMQGSKDVMLDLAAKNYIGTSGDGHGTQGHTIILIIIDNKWLWTHFQFLVGCIPAGHDCLTPFFSFYFGYPTRTQGILLTELKDHTWRFRIP